VDVWVSAASGWEISTKHRIGKLDLAERLAIELPDMVREQGFRALDVSLLHAVRAGQLPGPHRDPFDRLLAAQAILEGLTILSGDAVFDAFGVSRLAP
jgi:PIN domain nuclease of toxin-antitoxin system